MWTRDHWGGAIIEHDPALWWMTLTDHHLGTLIIALAAVAITVLVTRTWRDR